MRILVATGIYPPDIGGPATYSSLLAKELPKRGFDVKIITYGPAGISRKIPKGLRHLIYFLICFFKSLNSDVIYAQNPVSAGLPAMLVSKILRKKFIIRLGGDFLWERAVERGRTKKVLREYYKELKTLKERLWIWIIKKILNRVDKIIFSSNFQKEIYKNYFGIKENKIVVIPNPFPETKSLDTGHPIPNIQYQILYAGRFLKLKNLDSLIEVFFDIKHRTSKIELKLKIIGEGPEENNLKLQVKRLKLGDKVIFQESIPHRDLLKEIQNSYLCILPSLTEISPNFALECIKLKKPILLTQETGIYQTFKENLIFIDPQDEKDIEEKILHLLDKKNYQDYIEKIKNIPTHYSWQDVVKQHISLLKELI